MSKVYKNQTALKIVLNTGIDLSSATSAKIKYIKPDQSTGEWTATIESPATDGEISYTIQSADDLDMAGIWRFWAYVIFSDGTEAPGEPVRITIYNEGE